MFSRVLMFVHMFSVRVLMIVHMFSRTLMFVNRMRIRTRSRQQMQIKNVRQMHGYDDDGTSRKKNMTSDAANAAVNDANAAPRMTHKPKPHLARSGYT